LSAPVAMRWDYMTIGIVVADRNERAQNGIDFLYLNLSNHGPLA
jgi:hypothetical protein